MTDTAITVATDGPISTVTLSHKPSNVLSSAVLMELDRALGTLEPAAPVRVVILTAAGRFFCPGADIKELAKLGGARQGTDFSTRGQALLNRIERFDKPVIAAITGACLGGGLELAMACHMRVAAAGVSMGLPEIKLGLIPGFGGTQRLSRIIGPSKAAEMILTGETISSEDALALGLVNRVVPAAEVLPEATQIANKVATMGPLATQAALRAIRSGLDSPLAEGLSRESQLFGELCGTTDMQEGLQAFLEKRAPKFTGQ